MGRTVLEAIIDKLTRSIEERDTGRILNTEVCPATAAKLSFELGNEGFVVFEAKTALIEHYEKTLSARRIGNSQRMFLDTTAASRLLEVYFGEK